ncbi:MAG TPA: hypothetical protein VI336_02200 [Candidatus Saccharimonadales bacterium]|nr:hypothetical protein [Candidatus Saccharimonadales bacterium]
MLILLAIVPMFAAGWQFDKAEEASKRGNLTKRQEHIGAAAAFAVAATCLFVAHWLI